MDVHSVLRDFECLTRCRMVRSPPTGADFHDPSCAAVRLLCRLQDISRGLFSHVNLTFNADQESGRALPEPNPRPPRNWGFGVVIHDSSRFSPLTSTGVRHCRHTRIDVSTNPIVQSCASVCRNPRPEMVRARLSLCGA